jgi:hypothetical protein
MSNPIPTLPDPLCGATLPDGGDCPSASSAIVAVEAAHGSCLLVWRCLEHIAAAVDASVRSWPENVVTVTPLTAAEPSPQQPDPPTRRPLYLVSG